MSGLHEMSDTAKHWLDIISIAAAWGVIAKVVPLLAGVLSIIWTGLRIYDWAEARLQKRKADKSE